MKRRAFIIKGAAGAAISGLVTREVVAMPVDQNKIEEPSREIEVAGQYDVIVCGGGPAGVAAALASAREGAKTLLIEAHGCLGGVWTAGLLTWILDHKNKPGTMREIEQKLSERQPDNGIETGANLAFDAEIMKVVLEELSADAGVDILYHTRVVAAIKNRKNKLEFVVTENKSGRTAWSGMTFIDTTGDGDLAAQAGCGFDLGNAYGAMQPFSMLALVGGIRFEELKEYNRWSGYNATQAKRNLYEAIVKGGVMPSYEKPGLYPVYDDLYMLMANHEYEYSSLDAVDITRATINARREINRMVGALQSLGGAWAGLRLVATAEQVGIREGRRIHGLYTLSKDDLVAGARFDDAVCRATFGVDVHSVKKSDEAGGSYNQGVKSRPYDIPLRSLIARDVDGLMMAGRNISGDFIAHSSYRVTGNSVALGEAAGKVSAIAAKRKKSVRDVKMKETDIEVKG